MRTHPSISTRRAFLVVILAAAACPVRAQEMEPRAYVPAPVGLNFASATISQSTGGIAVDPSVPLDDVEATINAVTLGYLRTFGMLGRTASVGVGVPYAWGDVSGEVFEDRRSVRRSGLADTRVRLAVNVLGGPALGPAEYAAQPHTAGVGVSLTVAIPTGEYESDQLVNLGSNRWSVKPEIGLYLPLGAWSFELAGGAWFFTDNDDFFGGMHKEQDPVTSLQGHVSYTFRRNLWVAGDLTYFSGGRTTVDGERKADLQESTRAGLTASWPLGEQCSVKLAWSKGLTTRIGADFTTYGVTLQRAW